MQHHLIISEALRFYVRNQIERIIECIKLCWSQVERITGDQRRRIRFMRYLSVIKVISWALSNEHNHNTHRQNAIKIMKDALYNAFIKMKWYEMVWTVVKSKEKNTDRISLIFNANVWYEFCWNLKININKAPDTYHHTISRRCMSIVVIVVA